VVLLVRLLGAFQVSHGGEPVAISSRPSQALFAYLVLNAGTAHRREKLAGMLWPESLEETARDNLRHALWRVRKALPGSPAAPYLVADDLSIAFNAASEHWLDAAELERPGQHATADDLIAVLANYRGELLPGFYDEWVLLEREHLQSVFEHQMARLMSRLEREQRWLDILDWAERWIKLGQKPEPAYRALMTAHAAKGDLSKMAATYERCVKSLREYGIEPSEQTRGLYERLKGEKWTPATGATVPAPDQQERTPSHNLPFPITSFIGRKKELQSIAEVLASSRLVTLTGSGGVGKTRLAIQAASEAIPKFNDGIFWVGLVGLSDAALIPHEIAQSLKVREVQGVALIEAIADEIGRKNILLVLDNCEHLIGGAAQVAEQLLGACPSLKILATSRERLAVFAETVWHVPSLSENTSLILFAERARTAQHDFALTPSNESVVSRICQRLDRVPLAIELAAARVAVLSPDEILQHLDDRFSILTSGSRTALPRQQTLRATIDWSYNLLTGPERTLLCRLSVFTGGFTLAAAEAVCVTDEQFARNEVIDSLGRLTDKSLVIVERGAESEATRYRLLETIREYAFEKVAGTPKETTLRRQHLAYYLALAEEAEPHTYDRQAIVWFHRLDSDFDNIRAALDWAESSGRATAVLRITGSLVEYWFTHGRPLSEWYRRVEAALMSAEGLRHTYARAKVLNGMGFLYWGDLEPTDRRPQIREALAIGKELGDDFTIGIALLNLGMIADEQGDYAEAHGCLAESLQIWQAMGERGKPQLARTLHFLGDTSMFEGAAGPAESYYLRAAALFRELHNKNILAFPLRRLAQLAWRAGDHEKAKPLCRESLLLNYETDDPRAVVACLAGFADIAVVEGKLERAARLMGAIEALLATLNLRLLRLDQLDLERYLVLLRAGLEEEILSRCWLQGGAMSLDQATSFALEDDQS
jgi:predicted ATPase/DNA-binding SARP family transcriptional activator